MLTKILQPIFWYTDNQKLDQKQDKERIILQILNYGNRHAMAWLFKHYPRSTIKKVLLERGVGELDQKSLNYWCLIFGINKTKLKRNRL